MLLSTVAVSLNYRAASQVGDGFGLESTATAKPQPANASISTVNVEISFYMRVSTAAGRPTPATQSALIPICS